VIDYVKKTVTVEMHPHMHTYMLSVHPCKVGETMKKMIAAQKRCGISVSVEQYMFLYLKFVSAIIPTVEFDFTPDVPVNTSSK
jgi:ubiquitin-like-conjugating enzyme ATG3